MPPGIKIPHAKWEAVRSDGLILQRGTVFFRCCNVHIFGHRGTFLYGGHTASANSSAKYRVPKKLQKQGVTEKDIEEVAVYPVLAFVVCLREGGLGTGWAGVWLF